MKVCLLLMCLVFFVTFISGQNDSVISKVYSYNDLTTEEFDGYEKRQMINGSTTDNENLNVYVLSLQPSKSFKNIKTAENIESLIIIKDGKVKVELKDEVRTLSAGSIIYLMPGESYSIESAGGNGAEYYVLEYNSRNITSTEEESKGTASFIVNRDTLKFNPHDRGGIRQYFEKPTSMFRRFEMHVTNLKAGIKSHEPHTHRAEEIVLMIKGDAEMQIADSFYKGTTGDLYFLGANVSHAIQNTSDEEIMYFAFQWD